MQISPCLLRVSAVVDVSGNPKSSLWPMGFDSTSSISKLARSISAGSATADILKGLDSTNSISKLARSISADSAYSGILKGFDSTSSISKLARSISSSNAYANFLKEFDTASSIQKLAKSITDSSVFYALVERLSQYESLGSLFEEVEGGFSDKKLSFDNPTTDLGVHDAAVFLQELASAESTSGFSNILEKAPGALKLLLVNFLLAMIYQFLIGSASGVMGNLITPHVQEYLYEMRSSTQREQLNGLKKLSFDELGIELRGYRFITSKTLHLRGTRNGRAPIVGELKFGQVVSVISNHSDWTEVLYEYGDGSTVSGWVFTRYTAKFRN